MGKDDFIKNLERQALIWGWIKIVTVLLGLLLVGVIVYQVL